MKKILSLGIGFILVVFLFFLAKTYFYQTNSTSPTRLNQENSQLNGHKTMQSDGIIPQSVAANSLFGVIDIPKLALEAPILEGIQDEQINKAVGHLPTSVLPGGSGTSILAAHNVTWFRHIDELKSGDEITAKTQYGTYIFRITNAKVVHVGDPVYNTDGPSLVLESCYPLNALYLTPYRYLVFATLTSSSRDIGKIEQPSTWNYYPKLPNSIPVSETYLNNNSLPMGVMSYKGVPSNQFIQSNAPLNCTSSLVSLYLAWLHATANDNSNALQQLGVQAEYNPLLGHPLSSIRHEQLFNVSLTVNGDKLVEATGTDLIRVKHLFAVTIKVKPSGHQVVLESVVVKQFN